MYYPLPNIKFVLDKIVSYSDGGPRKSVFDVILICLLFFMLKIAQVMEIKKKKSFT